MQILYNQLKFKAMKRGTMNGYASVRTAQGILCAAENPEGASGACGSACGAGDTKPEEPKPAACGSACGAGEK